MAMSKGSVTINSETGAHSGSGAAYQMFLVFDGKQDYQGITGTALAAARQQIADLCESAAELIDYIKTNAVVNTNVSTTTVGTATGVTVGSGAAPTAGTGTGSGTGTVS